MKLVRQVVDSGIRPPHWNLFSCEKFYQLACLRCERGPRLFLGDVCCAPRVESGVTFRNDKNAFNSSKIHASHLPHGGVTGSRHRSSIPSDSRRSHSAGVEIWQWRQDKL